ncbi:cardioacceleratory peptide receptor-like [Ostrea edulis]|uniref:cardioacceleratory peptide receptor-like n=1 Tax=Ostrea edulis TaxID=37623 RepID=UPI0024AEBAE7|nr:cardioacceleratory peptide receptor-like [Ostrea edulis]
MAHDLLVGLLLVSQDITEKVMVDFVGGSFLCKFLQYIKGVVLYGSTYILVSLSIDRLDAVARPMRFSRREFRAKVLISAAWILSVLFSVPTLALFDVTSVTYNGKNITLCEPIFHHENEPRIYLTLIAIAAFIFPAIIIAVCYCVIIIVICRSSKEVQRGSCNWTFQRQESILSNGNVESCRSNPCLAARGSHIIERAKIRTVKMTFFIVLAFILCWCPYFGFMLHHVYEMGNPNTSTLKAVTAIIQSLAPLNSAVNPIIYGVFSTRICRNLRRVPFLRHFVCCGYGARRFGSRTSHTSIVEGFYLNDISSLRRRQWSGSKWNPDTDYRTSYKRTSRPLLHRDSSSLMLGQRKPERPISHNPGSSSSSRQKIDNEVDLILSRRPGRGVPLLSRELSDEDSELLRSFTLPKK